MAKIIKEIVTIGEYDIPQGDGKTKKVTVDLPRLRKWGGNINSMRSAGLRIPCPWSHYNGENNTPMTPVCMGHAGGGIVDDANRNAGFWESAWVDETTGSLWGVVDAPGSENDVNTPAGKLGTTVKETSVYVASKFTDPKTKQTWDEAPIHIAAVVHPVESGQSNFRHLNEGMTIAMSLKSPPKAAGKAEQQPQETMPAEGQIVEAAPANPEIEAAAEKVGVSPPEKNQQLGPDHVDGSEPIDQEIAGGGPLGQVVSLLRECAGVALPADTNTQNLMERLLIALTQKQLGEGDTAGNVYNPPEGAKLRTAPFVMSLSQNAIQAIVKSGAVNPDTGKPFTAVELSAGPQITEEAVMSYPGVKNMASQLQAMTNALNDAAKNNYRGRIESAVRQGKIGQDMAKNKLLPMVDAIVMSFQPDGKPVPQPLDLALEVLEANPALTPSSNPYAEALAMSMAPPAGARTIEDLPHAVGGDNAPMSEEQRKNLLAMMRARGV